MSMPFNSVPSKLAFPSFQLLIHTSGSKPSACMWVGEGEALGRGDTHCFAATCPWSIIWTLQSKEDWARECLENTLDPWRVLKCILLWNVRLVSILSPRQNVRQTQVKRGKICFGLINSEVKSMITGSIVDPLVRQNPAEWGSEGGRLPSSYWPGGRKEWGTVGDKIYARWPTSLTKVPAPGVSVTFWYCCWSCKEWECGGAFQIQTVTIESVIR